MRTTLPLLAAAFLGLAGAALAASAELGNRATPLTTIGSDTAGDRAPSGQAPQAFSDPQKLIYLVSGVRATGGEAMTGVATSFLCTNKSAETQAIRIRVFDAGGNLVGDRISTVAAGFTVTMSTHSTALFIEHVQLSPGIAIAQGTASIMATTSGVICSAMMIDASVAVPNGIALHMVRYNANNGSLE